MKRLLIFIFFLFPLCANGQIFLREYIFHDGWKIKKRDTVILGHGSMSNHDFAYIRHAGVHLSSSNAGEKMLVKRLFFNTFKPTAYLILEDSRGNRYFCKTEEAIKTGELQPPHNYWNYNKNVQGKPLKYRDTITAPGSKEDIYVRAINWADTSFKKPTGVIEKKDEDKKELTVDVAIPYHSKITFGNSITAGYIYYKITIIARDGNYIYDLDNFRHEAFNQSTQLYHSNKIDPYNFELLTTDPDCPNPKVYPYNGRRWSNKVWHELKVVADSAAQVQIHNIKEVMDQ